MTKTKAQLNREAVELGLSTFVAPCQKCGKDTQHYTDRSKEPRPKCQPCKLKRSSEYQKSNSGKVQVNRKKSAEKRREVARQSMSLRHPIGAESIASAEDAHYEWLDSLSLRQLKRMDYRYYEYRALVEHTFNPLGITPPPYPRQHFRLSSDGTEVELAIGPLEVFTVGSESYRTRGRRKKDTAETYWLQEKRWKPVATLPPDLRHAVQLYYQWWTAMWYLQAIPGAEWKAMEDMVGQKMPRIKDISDTSGKWSPPPTEEERQLIKRQRGARALSQLREGLQAEQEERTTGPRLRLGLGDKEYPDQEEDHLHWFIGMKQHEKDALGGCYFKWQSERLSAITTHNLHSQLRRQMAYGITDVKELTLRFKASGWKMTQRRIKEAIREIQELAGGSEAFERRLAEYAKELEEDTEWTRRYVAKLNANPEIAQTARSLFHLAARK